mgnify:CR=1 FL=1
MVKLKKNADFGLRFPDKSNAVMKFVTRCHLQFTLKEFTPVTLIIHHRRNFIELYHHVITDVIKNHYDLQNLRNDLLSME